MARLFLESEHYTEEGATFVTGRNGALTISVAETHAMGSYNQEITSSIHLTPEQGKALLVWLREVIRDA